MNYYIVEYDYTDDVVEILERLMCESIKDADQNKFMKDGQAMINAINELLQAGIANENERKQVVAIKEAIAKHLDYLNRYIKINKILLFGPKLTEFGSFVIIKMDNENDLEDFLKEDPMNKVKLLTCKTHPISITNGLQEIMNWAQINN
ncbi:YciI family protein [Mycoplasma sp. P36-A1]|uniref:YciI family protein n=1 Tax=Mycoplasma sp. P36-A1 TaxID=3252900 RepID=UPI003C30D69A